MKKVSGDDGAIVSVVCAMTNHRRSHGVQGELLDYEGRSRIDASKARRDLDHEPVISLAQGIHRTIDWMKSVYDE